MYLYSMSGDTRAPFHRLNTIKNCIKFSLIISYTESCLLYVIPVCEASNFKRLMDDFTISFISPPYSDRYEEPRPHMQNSIERPLKGISCLLQISKIIQYRSLWCLWDMYGFVSQEYTAINAFPSRKKETFPHAHVYSTVVQKTLTRFFF